MKVKLEPTITRNLTRRITVTLIPTLIVEHSYKPAINKIYPRINQFTLTFKFLIIKFSIIF